MSSVQRAIVETKSAWLNSEFGLNYAMKVFGLTEAEIEKIVGRYTKGKRAGQLKGQIIWKKCTKGGWYRDGASMRGGYVVKPNRRWDHVIIDPWGARKNDGEPKVLWSMTFKEWGWIPGETQEEFEARYRAGEAGRITRNEEVVG